MKICLKKFQAVFVWFNTIVVGCFLTIGTEKQIQILDFSKLKRSWINDSCMIIKILDRNLNVTRYAYHIQFKAEVPSIKDGWTTGFFTMMIKYSGIRVEWMSEICGNQWE